MALSIKQCYTSEGNLAENNLPCDPYAEFSACCGPDSVCMQNYFCRDSTGASVAGTCTDQLWGTRAEPNPACPCSPHYNIDNKSLNYTNSVTFCHDGSICCGVNNTTCCDAGKGNPIIRYSNPNVIPLTTYTAAIPNYYQKLKVTTFPVTRANATSHTATGTTSASATRTPSETSSPHQQDSLPQTTRIAIAAGASAAAVLLVIASTFIFILWKRYKKLKIDSKNKGWEPTVLGRHEAPVSELRRPALRSNEENETTREQEHCVLTRNSRPVELDTRI